MVLCWEIYEVPKPKDLPLGRRLLEGTYSLRERMTHPHKTRQARKAKRQRKAK